MTKAIVTDIEGTTSSLSFVKDVLFPYARAHLHDFVRRHAQDAEVTELLDAARHISGADLNNERLIAQFIDWIDRDQKITPLKSLQGLIWQEGYRHGTFKGHVYTDAAQCLKQWHAQGYGLYVYSSGSVYAQKLLFGHTEYGDLTSLFSGYFDTHIGGKQDAASYRAIAQHIGLPAVDILFLSDIEAELNAARAAGFDTCWLVRDQPIDSRAAHRQVNDFAAIQL